MKEAADLLRRGIAELGISLTQKQVEGFTLYLSELRRWNRTYNLTGLKSDRDIIVKHFLDSLLFTHSSDSGLVPDHSSDPIRGSSDLSRSRALASRDDVS